MLPYGFSFCQGQRNEHPFCPPNVEDIATICYTSGTTGTPKVLNMVSSLIGVASHHFVSNTLAADISCFCEGSCIISRKFDC